MKKLFLLSILFVFFVFSSGYAQSKSKNTIEKSKIQLSVGSGYVSGGFPIYAFADFTVIPNLTVGPQINFVFTPYYFHFVVSGRGDYHFNTLLNISDEWDLYAGATMGIDFSKPVGFSAGAHAGGRWYWSDKWGVNAEIGGGTYFAFTAGVSVKL